MSTINFFTEEIDFSIENEAHTIQWVQKIIESENFQLEEINFIFCADDYLLKVNQDYLSHDYYTDIITFDNSTSPKEIISDIFISVDRVKENAEKSHELLIDELNRVMIHGVLHLLGYTDATENDKILMRQKEDTCLSLRN